MARSIHTPTIICSDRPYSPTTQFRPLYRIKLPSPNRATTPPPTKKPLKYGSPSSLSPGIAKHNPLSQLDESRSSYGTHDQRVMQMHRHFRSHRVMIGGVELISQFDSVRPASLHPFSSPSVIVWLGLTRRMPPCAILSPNTVPAKSTTGQRYVATYMNFSVVRSIRPTTVGITEPVPVRPVLRCPSFPHKRCSTRSSHGGPPDFHTLFSRCRTSHLLFGRPRPLIRQEEEGRGYLLPIGIVRTFTAERSGERVR